MPEAVEHLGEALHYAPDTAMRFAAAEELTWALAFCGRWPEAFALGHQVLASMAPYDEAALRFEGRLAALAQRSAATARPALERLERLERYEHRLVGETAGERLVLACLSFRAANRGDTATTTADFARRALADGRLLHDDELGGPNFLMAVGGLLYTDRLDEADHHLGLALEAARSQGSETAFAAASGLRCQALLRRGRLVRAEAEALAALAAVDARAATRPMLLASVLSAMVERADPTTWEAFLVEQRIDGDLGDSPDPAPLLLSRARMRLALGDARAALRDLDDLRRRDERSGLDNPWTPSRAYRALAHLQLGEREEAAGLAADELTRAGRWGTPSALGGALRTMASVQGGDEAIELLRAAVTALDHSPARYELACSLAELGAALRRAGRFGEARQPLRRALEIADKCGAARLARATRDELVVIGARPRRAARRGCHPLTPRERRIAQLAAEGQANRDIAQALFMTVRMVETHLSHVYAKLDVLSPDRLAAALHA
jgi:DNA-binding CsgD family transcriptional regulator